MYVVRGLREDVASYLHVNSELPMVVKTKVFDLGKYRSLSELAHSMRVPVSEVSRVRKGESNINQNFILGAIRAFPEHHFGELFYITSDETRHTRTLSTQ